jgi:hypothetical protein
MSASPQYQLTVIVADLWPPVLPPDLRLPGLELLLARGQREVMASKSLEALLFEAFGAALPPGDLPVAPVTRMLDMGVADQEWWIRADPVHLVPRRDGLVLVPGALVELGLDEAQALCGELAPHYAAEGWSLRAPHPWRWYLRPPVAPEIQTTPLALVAGRDIHACLPSGRDARAWHTLMNEMQILLHTAQVNVLREQRGAPAVNSLWFWGGGRLPPVSAAKVDAVWADDAVARGLGRLAGVPAQPLPAGFEAWRDSAPGGRHLIVLDALRQALQRDAAADGSAALAHIDAAWFQPLVDALRAGAVESLSLMTDQGLICRCTRRQQGRWWRRRQPLSRFAPPPVSA